jgi:hypothetical protein
MSEDEKLLAHTTTEHLNGKLIHIQILSFVSHVILVHLKAASTVYLKLEVVVIYVVAVLLKRAYLIQILLFCLFLSSSHSP